MNIYLSQVVYIYIYKHVHTLIKTHTQAISKPLYILAADEFSHKQVANTLEYDNVHNPSSECKL